MDGFGALNPSKPILLLSYIAHRASRSRKRPEDLSIPAL